MKDQEFEFFKDLENGSNDFHQTLCTVSTWVAMKNEPYDISPKIPGTELKIFEFSKF